MSLNQIIFEHIDDKYSYGKYGDFKVIMMTSNRYINATKLCNEYNKRFDNWLKNDGNKQLINCVNNKLVNSMAQKRAIKNNISIPLKERIENNQAIIIIKGGKHRQLWGTYVHELLMDNIIKWIFKPENNQKEYNIVCKLNIKLNGLLEVNTPCGKIDILTDNEIIEVKEYKLWKHALGQILSYSFYYPDKQKWIHLFDYNNNDIDIDIIKTIYNKYNIILSYE